MNSNQKSKVKKYNNINNLFKCRHSKFKIYNNSFINIKEKILMILNVDLEMRFIMNLKNYL